MIERLYVLDSMIEASVIIVKQLNTDQNENIVVAMTDENKVTLKGFLREKLYSPATVSKYPLKTP